MKAGRVADDKQFSKYVITTATTTTIIIIWLSDDFAVNK